jgi:Raf kinase inhibitor-like YbhB/YbcL family protein
MVALFALAACGSDGNKSASTNTTSSSASNAPTTTTAPAPKIVVTSTAFANDARIPMEYTCDGDNKVVPISWTGIPSDARSVALEVHDPDAPIPGGFLHWIVLGLPPSDGSVPPLPPGARQGPNGTGLQEWTGPCPPAGNPHHYRFTVYALRTDVQRREQIKGATIAQGTLVGTYSR